MKTMIRAMLVVVGAATAARAADTTIKYEVSTDGLNWSTSVDALPGTQIQVRTRVVWTGATPVYGLGQVGFQPVVSGWTLSDHLETTAGTPTNPNNSLNPSGNGPGGVGPLGGALTNPTGSVPDAPGVWGRVTPFGAIAYGTSNYLRGFLGTGTAAGLLRIAQAQTTNWIGVGPTSGPSASNNFSGVAGVTTAQPSPGLIAGDPRYPAFLPGTDVVVFKFGFTIGASSGPRDLSISTPERGLYHEGGSVQNPSLFGKTKTFWYLSPDDIGSTAFYDSFAAEGAFVHVIPTPGGGMFALAAGVLAMRRRR